MEATRQLQIKVPESMYEEMKKMVYKTIYLNHVDYEAIVNIIKENPDLPIKTLQYRLRKPGFAPSRQGIIHVAEMCDLPYTK